MAVTFSAGRAVVVGIANYPAHVGTLPDMVRKDALDIASRLTDPTTSGYDPSAVRVLTNDDATADQIRVALKEEAQKSSPDGTLLFYFSGHGGRVLRGGEKRSVLIGRDWDGTDARALIFDDELLAIFARSGTARQVLVLDACHAGGFGALKGAPVGGGVSPGADFSRLAGGKGRVILSSSRADELSMALPGMANSLFTAALLDALGGAASDRGDGAIGVFEAFNFIADAVPKRARQHPVLKADLEENFALALRPAAKSAALLPGATMRPRDEQAEALMIALYPLGPTQDQVWSRAGGDLSRLVLSGHGAAQWHSAIRLMRQGGGGLSLQSLLAVAATDYPDNATVLSLAAAA